ncbi:MAG: ABC transporter ATP-binding protein [Lachnospiraceae bacterium]|nr:ABC transporter ATP-binding protein [Lachnospiraceae bacterium]
MEEKMSMIEMRGISRTFQNGGKGNEDKQVLQNVNFSVAENEFVVVFGPGQCGKTTLLNIIAGLDSPTEGKVFIKGEEVKRPGPDRAMVFQNILLFPWLTVLGNVEYSMKVRGIEKRTRQKEAMKYIELVGLKGFENTYPVKLSGGMKQRVGIARAYCTKPEVMLMDEPFGALDAQTRYLMQDEVIRIRNVEKRTVIFVTNNIEEALYLADRIVVMTECPSTVLSEVSIELPRPRSQVDPEFLKLRKEISKMAGRKR